MYFLNQFSCWSFQTDLKKKIKKIFIFIKILKIFQHKLFRFF